VQEIDLVDPRLRGFAGINRLTGRAGPRWRETLREQRLMAGLVLVSAGLLGGSWYVRNVLVSGNPLGFVQIVILGRVL